MEANHSDTGELARRTAREFDAFKATAKWIAGLIVGVMLASGSAFLWNRSTLVEIAAHERDQDHDLGDLESRVRILEKR